MGRGKPWTVDEKAKIAKLKDYMKLSNRQITKELNRGRDVVGNFLKNCDNYGKNYKTGRPKLISEGEKRRLIRCAANSLL